MTHEIQIQSEVYKFTLHPAETQFHRISGIYCFLIIPALVEAPEPLAEVLEANIRSPERWLRHSKPCHHEPTNNHQPTTVNQFYTLLYIGITNNFRSRFTRHHKINAARELGMTHIGILKVSSGRKRKKIEREILKYLNPPLNQTWLIDNFRF